MDSPLDSFPSEDPSPSSPAPRALRARLHRACDRYGITRARLSHLIAGTQRLTPILVVSVVGLAHRAAHALTRVARALTLATAALTRAATTYAAVTGRAMISRTGTMTRALGVRSRSVAWTLAGRIAAWRAQLGRSGGWWRQPAEAGLALAGATAGEPGGSPAPAVRSRSAVWVIATAALTSAAVSVLTVRLSSPRLTAVADPVAATSGLAEAPGAPAPGTVPERHDAAAPAAAAAGAGGRGRSDAVRAATSGPPHLVVITQPAGARVTVNGVGWGVSPVTIRHLPAGDKLVRVTMPGYRGEERIVRLDDAVAPTLRISLHRVSARRAQR